MDSNSYEAHIRRLDAQIQILKHHLMQAHRQIGVLILENQRLRTGDINICDPDYVRSQTAVEALDSVKPLKPKATEGAKW